MFNNSIVTDAGVALQESWIEGTVLTFAGAAAGAGFVPFSRMRYQTALADQRQTVAITNAERVTGGIKLTLSLTSNGVSEGYQAQQIGIYAKIGTGDPVLFALFQDATGMPVPSQSEMPDFSFTMYATIYMLNTGVYSVDIDPGALVNQQQLSAALVSQQNTVICLPKANINVFAKHQILCLSPISTVHAGTGGSKCFIGFACADAAAGTEKVSIITSGLIVGSVHVQTGGASVSAGTQLYPHYISAAIGTVLTTSSSGSMATTRAIYLAENIPPDAGDVYTDASVWMF